MPLPNRLIELAGAEPARRSTYLTCGETEVWVHRDGRKRLLLEYSTGMESKLLE
jgi:hypothetical protein